MQRHDHYTLQRAITGGGYIEVMQAGLSGGGGPIGTVDNQLPEEGHSYDSTDWHLLGADHW